MSTTKSCQALHKKIYLISYKKIAETEKQNKTHIALKR